MIKIDQNNLGSEQHLEILFNKTQELNKNIQNINKNLKNVFNFEADLFIYKKFIFNKKNIMDNYIYTFQRLGFNEYGYTLPEQEINQFVNIYNKKIMKIFYMHEVGDLELINYFRIKLKELLYPNDYNKIKDKYFRVEYMTAKYAGWHNDILFNTERDTYYGNLLWCAACPNKKYYIETEKEKIYLEKDKVYFLNDYENHRMLYQGNIKEKTKPVYLICFKISDLEENKFGIKNYKIS